MKNYTSCPICEGSNFSSKLKCKDYTVSDKTFNIDQCDSCGFLFTNPIPEENQIGKYYESEDYISHSNTSKGIINKLYQAVRNITLKRKLELVKHYAKGKKVLDIGSGTGEFLNTCKADGLEVIGIEPSESARKQSIENYNLKVYEENEINTLDKETFDVITMWHVLEHVYHLKKRVVEIHQLLNTEGYAIIAVPNHKSYDAKHYKEYWAAYDLPRHLYHFGPNDIKKLFEENGFSLEKTYPMKFDSFYVSMLSEKYKNGKGNLIRAFRNGWYSNVKAAKAKKPEYSSQIYVLKKN